MFEQVVKRMERLNDHGRRCIHEEYREWIEDLGDEERRQDAMIFKYMGNPQIK